jgi:tetratricopeptide (TPR) repeat protein
MVAQDTIGQAKQTADYHKLLVQYETAYRKKPDDSNLPYRIKILKARLGEKNLLEPTSDECGRDPKCDPSIMVELGNVWLDMHNYENAVLIYCQSIARYEQGYERGDYMKGHRRMELYEAYFNRGQCYFLIGKYREAMNDYARARDLNPADYLVWNRLGELQTLSGNYKEAVQCYEECFRMQPRCPEGWVNYGFALGKLDLPLQAIDAYSRALELPNSESKGLLLNNRGFTYLELRRYDDARADLDSAIRLKPKLAMSHISLAELHLAQKHYDDAIARLNIAEGLPELDELELFTLYYKRGLAHYSIEHYSQALHDFELALKYDATNGNVWYLLGRCQLTQSQECAALVSLSRSSLLTHGQPDLQREVVRYLLPLRQKKKGVCP